MDENVLNDYNPKLISQAKSTFETNSRITELYLKNSSLRTQSEMQTYLDLRKKCADELQTALSNEEFFFDTTFAIGAIQRMQRIPINGTNIPEVDFSNTIRGAINCLKKLGDAQKNVIESAKQYSGPDLQFAAGGVIKSLEDYQKQLDKVYDKLREVAPLFKDDHGIFKKFVSSGEQADTHSTTPDFKFIEGQINANTLKKNICDNLGLDPKQSSVRAFVSNLAKADKLLNDENIKDICNTGDAYAGAQIRAFLEKYQVYVKAINEKTFAKKDVRIGTNDMKKYIDRMGGIILEHVKWRLNQGDLSGASKFVENIQKKHSEIDLRIGARRLQRIAQNPLSDIFELSGNEAVEMWQAAMKHGFKLLRTDDLSLSSTFEKTFFSYDGEYFAKFKGKYFQWDSSSKEFVPTKKINATNYGRRYTPAAQPTQSPQVPSTTRSGPAKIDRGKNTSNKDHLYLFPYNKHLELTFTDSGVEFNLEQINGQRYICIDGASHSALQHKYELLFADEPAPIIREAPQAHLFSYSKDAVSKLKNAGLAKINTKQVKGKKYIYVEDADYGHILPELRKQGGISNVQLDSFTQTSLDRKKLERHVKLTENSVVASARKRLDEDKDEEFRDTISRLSKGGYSIVFYDIETTGNDPGNKTTDIIQIGAIKYWVTLDSDGQLKFTQNGKFNRYIRSDQPINKGAQRIHHITKELLTEKGEDKEKVINDFLKFIGGQTYTMGFNNRNFDDIILSIESSDFLKNINSFKNLDFRKLASLNYNRGFHISRGTLEQIFNVLNGSTAKETHKAHEDAEMVAKSLEMLLNQLHVPAKAATTTSDQSSEPQRKFTIQEAWKDSKKHRVEFDAASHKYKLHVGPDVLDVDTSVTSYISQLLPKSYDEKQFNSKMRGISSDLQGIYDDLADAIIIKMRRDDPSAKIPDFVTDRSDPFRHIDACFVKAKEIGVDTTTLNDRYVKLCSKLNETKPTTSEASAWGTTTHEFIQAVEYYFATSSGISFSSLVKRITDLYQHWQEGESKMTPTDKKLLEAIKNSQRLPGESKNTLKDLKTCIAKINSGALDNWLDARHRLNIPDSQKVKLPPNGQQENHFVAKITDGYATQYVGASVDLIFENYKDDRLMLIDLKATRGSNAQTYGAQVSLYKQIIEASEPIRVGKIDANVVYLPQVSNDMVEFDGNKMSNKEFRQNKMIANVTHELTGMELGELSEASFDRIDPSWQKNILGMSQKEIEDGSEKFFYHTIGGMTFSGWADVLGNYVKCAFVIRSWINSARSTMKSADLSKIEDALGIDSKGAFDFEHIESYLSQKDTVCKVLKQYGYIDLADNFRTAAGHVDKFIHGVLETYISNSSEGTESENAYKLYLMAGSKYGSDEQKKLREALASIINNKYGENIKKEQQKLQGNRGQKYRGALSDNAENLLAVIRARVNQTLINDKSFLTLADEEKRNKYIDSLFKNVVSNDGLSDELVRAYPIKDALSNTYRSIKFDNTDEGDEAADDFVDWLNGRVSYFDKKRESGEKALSNLIANIESRLKEYIRDCTSKDLVIDQLYEAAKYVAQELDNLFKRYCAERYGDYYGSSDANYVDDSEYLENKKAIEAEWKNAQMSDVFRKDIYGLKDSERRYTGKQIISNEERAQQIRYDLGRLTREYVGGMYDYLLDAPDAEEKTDQYWERLAKDFGAKFAEMSKEYLDLKRDVGDLEDFREYIRDLEEYVNKAFGGIDRLSYILSEKGADQLSRSIKAIYMSRYKSALNYKLSLIQQMHTYQATPKSVMTKLAKMVSLHTTIIGGTTMTVDSISNKQIYTEQSIMSRKEIVGILNAINKLISEHGQKSEWSEEDEQKYKKTIARKLRQLLKALFELRDEAERQKKLMSPEALEKLDLFKKDLNSAAAEDDDNDVNDKSKSMESRLSELGWSIEELDDKLWRDINEILSMLVSKDRGGKLKFTFDADENFESVEHFIKQFLSWQDWYGEDSGRKTSIALRLGSLSGSNGKVRVTGDQIQSALDEIYELSQEDKNGARNKLGEYLELCAQYCNILKNQGEENDIEFKDIINTLAQNGCTLVDSTYHVKFGAPDYIFHSANVPEAIELFKDMIHLRAALIEPLSIIQGILWQTQGVIDKGEGGPHNDKMRRKFDIYLKSFYKVFDNIFNKFKERNVKGTEDILNKFSEIIEVINGIDVNMSDPGAPFLKINTCINSIVELAKKLIRSTITSNEYILRSLVAYMKYARKNLDLNDISSELMRGGRSMSFNEVETLINDLRNADSDARIFFSQNEFKNFETADYVFDEKTIKSLISKGIIIYDSKKYGYFLEGVRIPREMLPADLRDSTEKPVIRGERGDLMGQLDINGDVNTILQQFLEGLQSLTTKIQVIVSSADGTSKGEGSKGASSKGESDKKDDAQKDSEKGKEVLDNLKSYIDLLEKEKRILREIKNLESEKTDESVEQINEKKKELDNLDKQKKEYKEIATIVDSSAEKREELISGATSDAGMSDEQKKKFSEGVYRAVSMRNDANRQDSPDEAYAKKYESEMRDIYKARMEADDKEFRYMQAMQKAKDPSVKAAYQALIDTQKKKKEEILEDEKKTHARYANKFTIKRDGRELGSEDIRKALQDEDDTNRSVKMNEILSQNPPKTYASQLEDAIKGSVRTFSLFSIVTRIMYKFMNSLRQCVNTMKELDKVQMDLRVVTGNSKEGIQELTKSYSELGFKLGLTTKEVAESANTWLRQGYSISETNKLIEATAKLSKLGMVDAASASRYLTSAIKGFHMEASEAESVVDRLVTLDMKYAASAGDIAQALARVSAVAQSSNTSLNETTAMLTTMIDVSQQGAESVGDALKTMMSRFGNVKAGAFTKLMDSEDSDNLNDIERVLNSIGITVRQSTMQMKSFSSVLDELYEKWDQLSNVEQNAIATAFAGQRQRNFFLLLMQNEESYRQALETTENAQGQAAEKYLAYMESYEYAAQQVKNAWEQITQQIFESDVFINLQKGLAQLIKRLPTLTGVLSKLFAATSMYRAPTMFSNVAAKLPVLGKKDPNVSSRWTREGGINKAREYSEQNALLNIKTLVENIFRIEERKEQRETHENNVQGNTPVAATGSSQPPKTTSGASGGTQVYKQSPNKTNFALRRMRLGAANSNADRDILAQQATYAAILSGLSTGLTGTSGFDSILSSLFSESYGDVKRTGAERVGAGVVSAVGTGVGAYFGGAAGAMAGSSIGDLINTITMGLFHYEEVQRLDRVKMANKIVDILNSIDDSVQKATNAVSINAAERTASDWQSIYKTRDEMQLAIYQLASEDIEKNGNGAFLFLSNFLDNNVNPSLEDAIAKLDGLTGSTERAQKVMQDFGAAYQVAKAEAEYAALESEIEEINKKLGEEKYVLGQAYLDATTAGEKSAIARQYAKRFPNSSVAQAAYAVQGEKARLRLNRENQYNTLLSAGLAASGMQQWSSYQIQNSAPDVVINNILEKAEKFLNDFGMTAKQNGVYTEEARKRAEAIVKKDEQLSNVYKQQASYYGRANRGVNRIQDALGVYNSTATVGVTMQQLKYMAKNYTAESWQNDATAKALMKSLRDTLGMSMQDVLRDIDLLADNLTGNIRKGFLLSTEAAEKFGSKLEYVTSEDALNGFDKFLEKMSDLEKLMDEITSSSGMAFESTEKVIKTYPWLLYGEDNTLGTNNITGNLIRFLGGNLSNSGDLVAQKAVGELWSGSLGESVWSEFASKVKNNEIGTGLSSGIRNIVTNSDYTTANSAFMAIMKDANLGHGAANELNKLFEDFIKNINLTEEYTAIYLKTIEKMNKWRTKMNENEISELESIKNNLSSVNSERERELKLIKAREALENAKNEKKRVYRTGKIMPLDNYIGQRPEVVKTEVRRFNRNRNDCRILLVTIILKLSPACRQYTV